jgi:hypothetical protein
LDELLASTLGGEPDIDEQTIRWSPWGFTVEDIDLPIRTRYFPPSIRMNAPEDERAATISDAVAVAVAAMAGTG